MTPNFSELGFRYPDSIIKLFVGGSQLTGTALPGNSDLDYYGIYLEPQSVALGLDADSHFVHNVGTARGTVDPDKVDVTLYSLRKWAGLAAKGNPSVLQFLFSGNLIDDAEDSNGDYWFPYQEIFQKRFLAKSHAGAFLGYANAQMSRLLNQRGGRDCNRPFLEDQFGYDTKYAAHIVRLLGEGAELMQEGTITYPRPDVDLLLDIRRGKYQLYQVHEMVNALENVLISCRDKSSLPETVDRQAISVAIADTYMDFWFDKEPE